MRKENRLGPKRIRRRRLMKLLDMYDEIAREIGDLSIEKVPRMVNDYDFGYSKMKPIPCIGRSNGLIQYSHTRSRSMGWLRITMLNQKGEINQCTFDVSCWRKNYHADIDNIIQAMKSHIDDYRLTTEIVHEDHFDVLNV